MTAIGLQAITLAFPDPDLSSFIVQGDFVEVNTTLAYSFDENDKIRTLSTTGSQPGNDIDGLLYTPDLPAGSCNASDLWVPYNATRIANLPGKSASTGLSLVALAPWISPSCTLAYFQAARSAAGVRAFIFYTLDNTSSIPPLANDAMWSLRDGGSWKTANDFPVYAIPSNSGQTLMQQLAQYSGNVTNAPNGHELANRFPPSDYIRLAVEIDVAGGNKVPSLWTFLLIVLGILIVIIGSTSIAMRWIQRRRRNRLRRHVINGEVDLEALGIRRLKVPQEVLDAMPTYAYTGPQSKEMGTPPPAHLGMMDTHHLESKLSSPASDRFSQSQESTSAKTLTNSHFVRFSQPTCAICLDDYTSESTVRELPCRHIFHPECIDNFLTQNSSLCPMCKKTVLPVGYCPAVITNAMVRRERMMRRIRDRVPADEGNVPSAQHYNHQQMAPRIREVVRSAVTSGRRVFSAPDRFHHAPSSVEMRSTTTAVPTPPPLRSVSVRGFASIADGNTALSDTIVETSPSPDEHPQAESRREWARQRASEMVGTRQAAVDDEIEAEAARRPGWRKLVGRLWPGFA